MDGNIIFKFSIVRISIVLLTMPLTHSFSQHIFAKNKQKSSSANISKTTPARKVIFFCKRWRRKKSPKKETKNCKFFDVSFLQHTVEWPSFNRRLLWVKLVIQSCCNSMCNFWREWGGGQPAMMSQTNANTSWVSVFRHFLLSAYHDWTPFVVFCKYPMETQYGTCTSTIVIIYIVWKACEKGCVIVCSWAPISGKVLICESQNKVGSGS